MTAGRIVSWPVDVLFHPDEFVRLDADQEPANRVDALASAVRLVAFYFVNLLLYAVPLTLAGFGVHEGATAPTGVATVLEPLVGDPDAIWQFTSSLFANGVFLLLATALTLATFHIGVVIAGSSNGIVQSLRAVSYSTGIYLAVMFSVVVYVSTEAGLEIAEAYLLWIQSAFIQAIIDFVGVNLVPPIEASRPEVAGMTTLGQAVITILLLAAVYFLYVLYVGARLSHDATRLEAAIATAFVLASPLLYVLGAIFLMVGLP